MKARQKGIVFKYLPDATLPDSAILDEKRLRQVLLNLLDNAIKLTDNGQVRLIVNFSDETSSQDDGRQEGSVGKFRFEVVDAGPGIPPQALRKIFLPFEQVGEVRRRYQGTGLGLAISQEIVQLMGGEIEVESEEGKGSTFRFEVRFPIVDADKSEKVTDFGERIVGYKGTRCSILVVDDKLQNRSVLNDMLTPLGFRVLEADNGHEGVAMALQMEPEIIFMDIVMPIMNGIEATKRIRSSNLGPVPIIAVSASAFEDDRERSIRAGCNHFLPKPIAWVEVYTILEHFLNLEWIYNDEGTEQQPLGSGEQAMVAPPLSTLNELHELAVIGDIREIRSRASALSEEDDKYKPFADKVDGLAMKFDDKEIVLLIERYM